MFIDIKTLVEARIRASLKVTMKRGRSSYKVFHWNFRLIFCVITIQFTFFIKQNTLVSFILLQVVNYSPYSYFSKKNVRVRSIRKFTDITFLLQRKNIGGPSWENISPLMFHLQQQYVWWREFYLINYTDHPKKNTIGLSASISFEIVNWSQNALGLQKFN